MADSAGFLHDVRRWSGLAPTLLDELARQPGDAEALARHAVSFQWLTQWQAQELLAGRGSD